MFFEDKDYFLTTDRKSFDEQKIREFLTRKGVALTDSGREIIRQKGNASDKFLEIIRTVDLEEVLNKLPDCVAIATTGQKATDTLLSLVRAEQPKVGGYTDLIFANRHLRLYRMPSSSRAYPKPLPEKAAVYRQMFEDLKMLED